MIWAQDFPYVDYLIPMKCTHLYMLNVNSRSVMGKFKFFSRTFSRYYKSSKFVFRFTPRSVVILAHRRLIILNVPILCFEKKEKRTVRTT